MRRRIGPGLWTDSSSAAADQHLAPERKLDLLFLLLSMSTITLINRDVSFKFFIICNCSSCTNVNKHKSTKQDGQMRPAWWAIVSDEKQLSQCVFGWTHVITSLLNTDAPLTWRQISCFMKAHDTLAKNNQYVCTAISAKNQVEWLEKVLVSCRARSCTCGAYFHFSLLFPIDNQ